MGEKFVSWILNNHKKSLGLGIILSIAITAGAVFLKPNFSYRIWFTEVSKDLQAFDEFEKQFGSDESALVVVQSESGIFDLDTSNTIIKLTNKLWKAPDVIRVDSLSNFNWTHASGDDIEVEPLIPDDMELTQELLDKRKKIAINHRSVEGYLVNKDATVAIIYVKLKPFIGKTPDYDKIAIAIKKIVSEFEGKSDHKFHLAGNTMLTNAFKEATQKDLSFLVPLVMLMSVIFLFLNLKSVRGVMMSLLIIGCSIALTMGAAGWLGIEINNVTGMVPQFMIAIGIADSVHILVTYYLMLRKGLPKDQAVEQTLKKNLRPTLLTSLSTAFGFFSFTSAGIPPIFNMGVMSGIGTLLAWLMTYLYLGPLMLMCKTGVKLEKEVSVEDANKITPFSYRMTDMVYSSRYLIIALFVGLATISFYFATKIEVNSDPIGYFDKSFHLRKATDFVEKHVGGAMGGEIVIDSGKAEGIKEPLFMQKVVELQNKIEQRPFITKAVSVTDILKDTNKSLNGGNEKYYVVANDKQQIAQQLFLYTMSLPQGMDLNDRMTLRNDKVKMTTMWTLRKSGDILDYADWVQKTAADLGLNAKMTGKAYLWQTINDPIVDSFIKSLLIAVFLIGILLIIGLKSIKIGLFSMIPNSLPLIFGGGMIAILGKYLDIGTVIVGSICLGIAVDDTIHFVSNFIKHINSGKNMRDSIALIFTHTAPALIVTTMVLVVSFGTFIFGTFVPNQNFGLLVAMVLSYALIADLLFLPALLFVVGENFFRSK